MEKHWSGQICPKSGTYGQYNDATGAYAGTTYDKMVDAGEKFPPSQNNHHYKLKS
jgi:hypothetical protein